MGYGYSAGDPARTHQQANIKRTVNA